MGKIFDALEKSNIEHKSSLSAANNACTVNEVIGKQEILREKSVPEQAAALFEKKNYDKDLVVFLNPLSFEAEQFKALKTNILFPVSGKPPRTIMVTSAVPGEGKSFVAANLAASIAQNIDTHVLLIDCDLRKPCLHSRFGIPEAEGLSEYLGQGGEISTLLRRIDRNNFTLLPAGRIPDNPSELLSSKQMSNFLAEAGKRYTDRIIIIDTPPPNLAPETTVIARQVDGILLVVNYGHTNRELISQAIEMIGKDKILGVTFNRFNMRTSSYYGYGKYGNYKKYYGKPLKC